MLQPSPTYAATRSRLCGTNHSKREGDNCRMSALEAFPSKTSSDTTLPVPVERVIPQGPCPIISEFSLEH
jgi:hypothetical protein